MPSRRVVALLLFALGALPLRAVAAEPATQVVVFAAASLTDALGELGARYQQQSGRSVRLWFASSAILARQIDSGAGADVFLSADPEWMDYLEQRNLIAAGSRSDLLTNALVLVGPADGRQALKLVPHVALLAALDGGRLAMGDPDSVPAGRYAKAALIKLGVWAELEARLVRAENVRAALAYVARGEAPLGIVYATDAQADRKVRILDTFATDLHPAIRYPLALTRTASPEAAAFVAYLRGASAAGIFRKYGFGIASTNAR